MSQKSSFCSGRGTPNSITGGQHQSPIKKNVSGLALSRHYKLNLPIHTLFVSSPIIKIHWQSKGATSVLADSVIAVSTSPISGANAGGNGEHMACLSYIFVSVLPYDISFRCD